jgi:transposase
MEVKHLTWQQRDWLMSGLEIEQPKTFRIQENLDNIPVSKPL